MKFSEFGFADSLLEGLDMMGFKEATPIQEKAIPAILHGDDVLAVAQTGTGKTAAFLLPIIQMLTRQEHIGIHTLILGPTRELIMQVDQQLEALSYFTGTSSIPIYGGRGGIEMEQEKRALKRGADIVVATPGRLISHLEMGYAQIDNLQCLILDEADRMLDMGFAPAIQTIVNKLPQKRQTLLFSATMPHDIRRFSKQLLTDPVEINIAISKPAENIMQGAYEVSDEGKIPLTAHLLEGKKNLKRIIIFASTKKKVRDLTQGLQRAGLEATDISSDLEQSEREKRLQSFKNGTIPIVVATDVLSRGIDVKGIDLVINYDVPSDAEDYVHRIGRTARAAASGVALTYINGEDTHKFKRIEDMIEMKVHRIPLPSDLAEFKATRSRSGGQSSNYRGKSKGPSRGRNNKRRNRN